MTAENSVQDTIDQAWDAAEDAMDDARRYADQAQSAASSTIFTGTVHNPDEPEEIVITKPDIDGLDDKFANEYDAVLNQLKTDIDNMLDDFLDKYFPDYTAKLKTISDWLDNAIKNGGTGIPANIESAIYDRARARLDNQAMRAEKEVFDVYAQRGYPLPPGVATEKLDEVRQNNQNENNNISREIMIKQAELEVDQIRFAIQQGVSLHTGILAAGQNYMGSVLNAAGIANNRAQGLVNSIIGMYEVINAYVRAEVAAEGLQLDYDRIQINRDLSVNQIDVNAFQAKIDARVKAAMSAARAMGDQAAAAIGSQNTLATIAHNTLASG